MRKTLSVKYLKSISACNVAVKEFAAQPERNTEKILKLMIKRAELDWTSWLICRLFPTKKMNVQYAIFAARQVLGIYEATYPDDNRPRQTIEAVETYLKASTAKNKNAVNTAYSAARAAYRVAANMVSAGDTTCYSAVRAVDSAAYSAASVVTSMADGTTASVAASAGANAVIAAASVPVIMTYRAAHRQMSLKIIRYGLKLLGVKNKL